MARKSNRSIGTRKYIILFFILFGLIFARYCYFGFEYFYQLDDYIQYYDYTAFNDDIGGLISGLGLLSSRPLAGIFDLFIWARFYGTMLLAVAIISAMYAGSAILLHKVFSKHFGTGLFFFVIYALLPIGMEGLYWVSASSRIVMGLFFAALSLFCFDKWCAEGKKSALAFFTVFQFICYCFYEQVLVFSAAATLVIMLLNAKSRNRRALWGFFMFANAALYLIFTSLAPSGVYGDRTSFFFPWQEGYFTSLFVPLGAQLAEIFTSGTAGIFGKGLLRGFGLLISEPNVIWCLVIILLCSGLFLMARDDRRHEFKFLPQLLSGLFLAAAPIMLFFIIDSPWFGLRNLVTSFCGFSLIGGALLDLVFCRMKKGRVIEAAVVSVLALLCCVASVSELYDYRQTTVADTAVSAAAYDAVEGISLQEGERIWLLNVDASYVENGNFYFHEHGYGVTSSDWALTGAVRAIGNDGSVPALEPVSVHRSMTLESAGQFAEVKAFFYKDGSFLPVTLIMPGNFECHAISASGEIFATLHYNDGSVTLTIN